GAEQEAGPGVRCVAPHLEPSAIARVPHISHVLVDRVDLGPRAAEASSDGEGVGPTPKDDGFRQGSPGLLRGPPADGDRARIEGPSHGLSSFGTRQFAFGVISRYTAG